jgi:LysM repeat protein
VISRFRPAPIFTLIAALITFVALTTAAYAQEAVDDSAVIHIVQPGENLYRIAIRYGVTINDLVAANQITNQSRIFVGQRILIPGLSVPDDSAEVENPLIAGTPVTHVVQPGETLASIASRYGTTVTQIVRANNIANPDRIDRGQSLHIWTEEEPALEVQVQGPQPPVEVVEAPVADEVHIVRPGEILSVIAQRYGVPMGTIMQANNIANADRVLMGQRLVIPGVPGTSNTTTTPSALQQLESQIGVQMPRTVVAPVPTVTQGKQIIVDLSDSMTYAYQDGRLVYSVLSSMGRPATPTVVGEFKIYRRLESQAMSGPGYYLPGVPHVQYFYAGYALHGAYWHENWGNTMSHGCVNLPLDAAEWLYNFAELGTPVLVQH